ncbi:unnamed protein product [Rangifer tarandus platyrhynchus]|uniref:Uncharacterized protein n=2 Tax=Rangifer tarandus platyrhynchus TaxID=3082113 RepID=A0ABN8ZIE3_RANTA|nr:unnamed protein product [Rangifer tarandus platyrhynchus]CAI9708067.1 unnamed protein product [Rangifer tarandus platyrhynchus]
MRGGKAPPPSLGGIAGMRSGRSSATTHQLRIVAGGSGALGSPPPKKEKEAEEVGVRGASGGGVPGGAPRKRVCPWLPRHLVFCARCQVAAAPALCGRLPGVGGPALTLPRDRAAPHAPRAGAGAPPDQAGPAGPASPARPAPAALQPRLRPRPPRQPRPRSLRRTGGLRAPGRGWCPGRSSPVLESSFCLGLDIS